MGLGQFRKGRESECMDVDDDVDFDVVGVGSSVCTTVPLLYSILARET